MQIAPDQERLANLTARLDDAVKDKPGFAAGTYVNSYILGYFAGMFKDASQSHGLDCAGCDFCAFLTKGITVVAALQLHDPEYGQAVWDVT